MSFKSIWKELRRQLTNTPSYALRNPNAPLIHHPYLEHVNKQIEEAIKKNSGRLVFLLGTFGSGKTTQVNYFMKTHASYHYTWRSFVKVNTLDFAFLHLTTFSYRFCFLFFVLLAAGLFMRWIPSTAAFPFLFIAVYLCIKNTGNLVYLGQETWNTLTKKDGKVIVIEDLERSSLPIADQWALLANLWQLKRTYLVPIGYAPEEKGSKLKMIEKIQKLAGVVIEIPQNKRINYELITYLDPDFPFDMNLENNDKKCDWITLFTPREMLLIQEQVLRNTVQSFPSIALSPKTKQLMYVHVCLEFLTEKMGIDPKELIFDEKSCSICGITNKQFTPEQLYYLNSFVESCNIPLLKENLSPAHAT